MKLRSLALLGVLAGLFLPVPQGQAAAALQISPAHPSVSWRGSVNGSAPLSCGNPNLGCDERDVVVDAPKGSWVTIAARLENGTIRITSDGAYVASGGRDGTVNPANTPTPTTTFQQLRSGRVTYHVAVGSDVGAPDVQTPIGGSDSSYTGSARLAGKAFDRAGECGVSTGAEHLQDGDDGRPLPLSVRLVAQPSDQRAVRAAGRTLVDIYDRIGVRVRVSYDFRRLDVRGTEPAYLGVWRAYGRLRPRGVDVVHVMTDLYAGGVADCIGGVAYPEKGFSVGGINYNVQGTVTLGHVPAGMVAAHEIGHELGAQHQQVSCAEALPQQAARPAKDGWVGPCTLMSPAALVASETFSTLERATIRSFVRRHAKG